MTEKKSDYQKAITQIEAAATILETLSAGTEPPVLDELTSLVTGLRSIRGKVVRTEKLAKTIGIYREYFIINEHGEPQRMTKDETYRYIMGYPKKGAFNIDLIRQINEQLEREFNLSQRAKELFQEATGARDIAGD